LAFSTLLVDELCCITDEAFNRVSFQAAHESDMTRKTPAVSLLISWVSFARQTLSVYALQSGCLNNSQAMVNLVSAGTRQ
jgi:hypothetical protein